MICLFGKCLTYVEAAWIAFGFLGQGIFFMRWAVQWLTSERHSESRIPIAFWYLSLIGGLITLAYVIYRKDPVLITGQALGALVYLRNLILIYRNRSEAATATAPTPTPPVPTPKT